jgi:hypothetical protein
MISGDAAPYQTLLGELQREQPGVVCTVVDESNEWQRGDLVHPILLPHAMVRTIASAMIS